MKLFHLLIAVALAGGAAAGEAQREVRVRQTDGGPMIHVDGHVVPPRMFWGRSGSHRYKIGEDWTPFALTFRAPVDQALFTVTDAKPEEILERFPDGSPSVVMRRHGAGADVFVSKPDLTAPLLHRLAALAGVHLYLPDNEVGKATLWATGGVGANGWVLEVQAMEDTTLHLRFPSAKPIRDAVCGKAMGTGPILPLTLAKGETRVLIAE